jgi:hypothetical protein
MKKHALIFSLALSGLFLWGCYPGGVEYVDDMDVVATYHNPDYDFAAQTGTYFMPDKIVNINGNLVEGEAPEFIKEQYARPILNQIEADMDKLGWTRVKATDSITLPAGVNLILLPSAVTSTTIVYYYDYWSYWYGGYYPYYGGGYTTSYTTGTLLMTLIDKSQVDYVGKAVTQWNGAINGLLTGYGNISRVTDAIDQAFAQSPYLKIN